MKGIYFGSEAEQNDEASFLPQGISLLLKNTDMEIMMQNMVPEANVWLTPANNCGTTEFFFIHRGAISIKVDNEERILRTGDYFYMNQLEGDLPLHVLEDTIVLYISNTPVFIEAKDFEQYINQLISQINDKDKYTYQHSANVMCYSTQLYEKLCTGDEKNEAVLNDMLVAALFHDVGKCYTPDEILKKKGKLDPEEMRYIRHHPIDSGRLLRKHYSERVAEIAEHHHERIDGTGYPYGLSGDEISLEAKIVAVSDAFDAMTTDRGYNRVKSFIDAAEELYSMPEKFDKSVTTALLTLIKEGNFRRGGSAGGKN